MLALEVEYLLGRAVATDSSRRDVPEWPPHPARLFSALVDALADVEHDSAELHGSCTEVLRWLEGLPPPEIKASVDRDVSTRSPIKYWVPINDEVAEGVRSAPVVEQRKKQERYFPAVVPNDPQVVFAWPAAELGESGTRALDELVRRVSYMGHSSSLVRVCRKSEVPARNLIPGVAGRLLRVPGPGRLARLQIVHELRRQDTLVQPPKGREVSYGTAQGTYPLGPHGDASVVAISGFPVGLEHQALLVARYRAALLSLLDSSIPESLSGHAPDGSPTKRPHIAFAALANVDHAHADGAVKGLAVVLPRELGDADRRRLRSAMSRLRVLHFGARGSLEVRSVGDHGMLRSLDFGRYSCVATRWVSVTPVALGTHPKPKKGLTEEVCLAKEVARLGLPDPVELLLQNVSFVRGAPRASDVYRQNVNSTASRLLRHVHIRFDRPVSGPLLLGAGRHSGFGLMLPRGE